MRNPHVLIALSLAYVLLLGACVDEQNANGTNGTGPATTTGGAAADGAAAASDAAASADQPSTDVGEDVEPAEGTDAADAAVVGEWLALFGRHDTGILEQPWIDGHRMTFEANGTGEVVKLVNGQDADVLSFRWWLEDDQLTISFAPLLAVKTGLSQVAPLGIARDEEIGLLSEEREGAIGRDEEIGLLSENAEGSIGRDEEIGLLQEQADGQANAGVRGQTRSLTAIAEKNYLALSDEHSRLLVYGRLLTGEPAKTVPDLSGDWVGHIEMHDNFPAEFTWDGTTLTGKYDHDGGTFRGGFVRGYFVGRIEGGPKLALAALRLSERYELDGVYLPDPYIKAIERYDFNRYTQ